MERAMIAAVYADSALRDVRMVRPSSMEFAFGKDENDFEVRVPDGHVPLALGGYLYVDGTELGGMVIDVTNDPDERQRAYGGMTWHGMLAAKVLQPDSGSDYLTVSGELNSVVSSLIKRVGLDSVMSAPPESSGIVVKRQLARYCTAYEGISSVMASVGMVMRATCIGGNVVVSAERRRSLERKAKTSRHSLPVNHLVCLGKGELASRTVVHLYADANGSVSRSQTLKGSLERAEVYDYSSAEESELVEKGTEHLLKEQVFAEASFSDFGADELLVGDEVWSYDAATDLTVTVPVEKKIVSMGKSGTSVSYEAGDATIKQGKM